MLRRVLISMTVVASTAFAGASLSSAQPVQHVAMAQPAEETASAPVADLALGERFTTETWELEVQDAFVTESLDRAGYVEIRASVAFRALGGQTMPYEWAGLTGLPGYPTLQIIDAVGIVYPIDAFEPGHTLVPGSHLLSLEPFVPARWSVGFEANAPQSDELSIQALWDGDVVAQWDVFSTVQALQGWTPPPGAHVLDSTGEFDWDEQLVLRLIDHGIEACGDSSVQPLFTTFAAQISVENTGAHPGLFPNVLYPEPTAIAIWAEGASAQMTSTADPSIVDTADDGVVINARSPEQLIVPSASLLDGLLTFALPRDGRFGDVNEPPAAILLFPPGGTPRWWDVEGAGNVTFEDACADTVGGPAFEASRPPETLTP